MPVYRLEVPDLILIESIRFAFFVIDFNRPAMASDARDPPGLPVELVGEEVGGGIGKVRFLVVDDQPVLPKVMDTMGLAVAVVGLLFSFVSNGQLAKDRGVVGFEGVLVVFLKACRSNASKRCSPSGNSTKSSPASVPT